MPEHDTVSLTAPTRSAAVTVRPAVEADVPRLHALILQLAEHEGGSDKVKATAQDLHRALFGPTPSVFCEVAVPPGEERAVGIALWFRTYSTWEGRHGIWLEDLFVDPAHRGAGVGRALLAALAARCSRDGDPRLEWLVRDANTGGRRFYQALGARQVVAHTVHRLSGDELAALADTHEITE